LRHRLYCLHWFFLILQTWLARSLSDTVSVSVFPSSAYCRLLFAPIWPLMLLLLLLISYWSSHVLCISAIA
jgi:hypothetical protein